MTFVIHFCITYCIMEAEIENWYTMGEGKRKNILGYDVGTFNIDDLPEEKRRHMEETINMIEAGRISELDWGPVHQGRPPISDEELQLVSVKVPASLVKKIDKKTNNRSEFIRAAIVTALAQ